MRNYEDLERGFVEMRRVLKDGDGWSSWNFPYYESFPFKQLYNFYFANILPLIGRLTSKDPKAYRYLYESVQAFPDGEDFIKNFEKAGYKSNHAYHKH